MLSEMYFTEMQF